MSRRRNKLRIHEPDGQAVDRPVIDPELNGKEIGVLVSLTRQITKAANELKDLQAAYVAAVQRCMDDRNLTTESHAFDQSLFAFTPLDKTETAE